MSKLEYRCMFNAYDGKGDLEYSRSLDPYQIVKDKAFVEEHLTNEKGICWLELRRIEEWKRAEIK